jgi:hypothetical protein
MIGTSWIREQGLQDALLAEALRRRGMDDVPLWTRSFPERDAAMQHWNDLTPKRDGPVNPARVEVADEKAMNPARVEVADEKAMAEDIKARARALGAADTGMTALRPEFIELGVDLPYKNVIAVICYEDYAKSLVSPDAVDLEAMSTYALCADVATELARQIREELGYPALAHHNGSFQIQAIPVFHEVGFGELGRHGSDRVRRPGLLRELQSVPQQLPRRRHPRRLHRHRRQQALAHRYRQVLSDLAIPRVLLSHLRRRLPLYLQGERRRGEARHIQAVHEGPQG